MEFRNVGYLHPSRILVALDCIIFGFDGESLRLLLIKRNFEPERGKWSLMGGFLNADEDLEVASQRILFELTGLNTNYLEQFQTFGALNRDPAERTISVVYYSLVNIADQDVSTIQAHNAYWISLSQKPALIFDHDAMVEQAMRRLRYRAALHAIGFELLPEKFTIPQLQKVYEAIFDTQLDRRNFRRKVMSTGLLISTGEKDTQSVTKKGELFRLNAEKYKQYIIDYVGFYPELTLA